jgi:hypothetical protein
MFLVMQDGRSFLLQGGISTIGRSLDNTIVLADSAVSRRHAEIRWDASGVYVRDVGSANGTKVDGLRLQPGQWRAIYPNSQVMLGDEVRCQVLADIPVSPQAAGMPPAVRLAAQSEPPRPATPIYQAEAPAISPPRSPRAASTGQTDSGLDLLLRAVDASLDRRKLLVTLAGTALAGLAAFLAFLIADSIQYESVPLFVLFAVIGVILVWVIMSLTFGAVTQISYADLAGRNPVTVREAARYALRRAADFALAPLALLFVVALVGLAEVIIMLIGRVPYVGELLVSLLFLPALVLNLFLVVVVSFGSSLIYPVIVDRGRGVAGTLMHVLVVIRHAPARVAFYLGIAGLLAAIATGVLWLLLSGALILTMQALMAGLGLPKFSAIGLGSIQDVLPVIGALGGIYGGTGGSSFTYTLAGRLIELGVLVALAFALAFPLVLQISLACAVYFHVKDAVPEDAGLLK